MQESPGSAKQSRNYPLNKEWGRVISCSKDPSSSGEVGAVRGSAKPVKGKRFVCLCVLSAQSCLTLCDSVNRTPPSSSVHGISQARMLVWGAISYLRGSSWPRDQTFVSCVPALADRFFTTLLWYSPRGEYTIRIQGKGGNCQKQLKSAQSFGLLCMLLNFVSQSATLCLGGDPNILEAKADFSLFCSGTAFLLRLEPVQGKWLAPSWSFLAPGWFCGFVYVASALVSIKYSCGHILTDFGVGGETVV